MVRHTHSVRNLRLKSHQYERIISEMKLQARRFSSTSHKKAIPSWATLDPNALGVDSTLHHVQNLVKGNWDGNTKNKIEIPNPINKDAPGICTIPDTSIDELAPFAASMQEVSKSGVHNPLKNVERYLMYGDISRKVGA